MTVRQSERLGIAGLAAPKAEADTAVDPNIREALG